MLTPKELLPHRPPAILLSKIISIEGVDIVVEMDSLNRDESAFVLIEGAAQAVRACEEAVPLPSRASTRASRRGFSS